MSLKWSVHSKSYPELNEIATPHFVQLAMTERIDNNLSCVCAISALKSTS